VLTEATAVKRDANHELLEAGHITCYNYDSLGNVSSMSDPRGTSNTYPPEYKEHFTITYFYDDLNRLIKAKVPTNPTKENETWINFSYDERGNLLERREPDGGKTRFSYTSRNWLETETKSGEGIDHSYTLTHKYDPAGNEKYLIDNAGNKVEKNYDALNRLIKIINSETDYQAYSYDLNGNQTHIYDGRGNLTLREYNSQGKNIKTVDALGHIFTADYDRWGNPTRRRDANQNELVFQYDELYRKTKERDAFGQESAFRYDSRGGLLWSQDANGTESEYEYTAEKWVKQVILRQGERLEKILYSHDEAGNLKSIECNGVITEYNTFEGQYIADPHSQVYRQTTSYDGEKYTVDYEYDSSRRLTSITYPNSNKLSYEYNSLGELLRVPGYVEQAPLYDSRGMPAELVAVNGVKKCMSYDKNARLTTLQYANKEKEELKTYALNYDGANNLRRLNNSTYTYDELNRLVFADLHGHFSSDIKDERFTSGVAEKDHFGEKELTFNGEDAAILKLDYGANSLGLDLKESVWVNRLILEPKNPVHRLHAQSLSLFISEVNADKAYVKITDWKYQQSEAGCLEVYLKSPVKGRFIKIHSYFDDREGERRERTDKATFFNTAIKILKVFYLTEWRQEAYTYDGIGNRHTFTGTQQLSDTKTYSYYPNASGGDSTRLKSDGEYAYEYDKMGNLTRKVQKESGAYWEYEYNLLYRLTEVRKFDPVSEKLAWLVRYTYDGTGLRIKKESQAQGVIHYVFDTAGNVLFENAQEEKKCREYIYVSGQHFARVESSLDKDLRKKYFYLTDHLGSTVAVTDEEGKSLWSNDYLPFGKGTGETGLEHFEEKFSGKSLDTETGLHYFNSRWYDASLGRFISEDPLRFGPHWYTYTSNNPLSRLDPTGTLDFQINLGNGQFLDTGAGIVDTNTKASSQHPFYTTDWQAFFQGSETLILSNPDGSVNVEANNQLSEQAKALGVTVKEYIYFATFANALATGSVPFTENNALKHLGGRFYLNTGTLGNREDALKLRLTNGEGKFMAAAVNLAVDMVPGLGDLKGIIESIAGEGAFGEKLATWERVLGILCIAELKGVGRLGKQLDDAARATKLLEAPNMIKHHIFNKFRGNSPASQVYRDFFKKYNIKVDNFTVELTDTMHKQFIHRGGNNWTTRWKQWIDSNLNATTKDVYQFAGRLMDEYGLSGLPIVPY
jgi:RHS repeat-associated protein